MRIRITRNDLDSDMLNLTSTSPGSTVTTLWAVVHEDFLSESLRLDLEADGTLDILFANILDSQGALKNGY